MHHACGVPERMKRMLDLRCKQVEWIVLEASQAWGFEPVFLRSAAESLSHSARGHNTVEGGPLCRGLRAIQTTGGLLRPGFSRRSRVSDIGDLPNGSKARLMRAGRKVRIHAEEL